MHRVCIMCVWCASCVYGGASSVYSGAVCIVCVYSGSLCVYNGASCMHHVCMVHRVCV